MRHTPDEALRRERTLLLDALRTRAGIRSERVLEALARVPREAFLPDSERSAAYRDAPLPIGSGQTISAPHMVATMVDALDVRERHRVLEVGGGSGYHAAVLAELTGAAGHVWSVERVPELAERAERQLAGVGAANRVTVRVADGARGLPDAAPFDRISVAAAAPDVPDPLVEQLAPDGVLLVPVGDRDVQELRRVRKDAEGALTVEPLGAVRFVPLVSPLAFPP